MSLAVSASIVSLSSQPDRYRRTDGKISFIFLSHKSVPARSRCILRPGGVQNNDLTSQHRNNDNTPLANLEESAIPAANPACPYLRTRSSTIQKGRTQTLAYAGMFPPPCPSSTCRLHTSRKVPGNMDLGKRGRRRAEWEKIRPAQKRRGGAPTFSVVLGNCVTTCLLALLCFRHLLLVGCQGEIAIPSMSNIEIHDKIWVEKIDRQISFR